MAFTFRPYADADAPAIADLFNAVEVHVGSEPRFTAAEMTDWAAIWTDRALNTRIAVAPDGSVAGFGVVVAPPEGGFRVDVNGTVDPARRGQGIGRELFGWQMARARELYAEAAPDIEWSLECGANALESDALHLYERSGLSVRRHWFDMAAPTAGVSAAAIDGLRIETAEGVDQQALYEAHMEAFADHFGFQRRSFEEWSHHSVASSTFRPELSRIAYDGTEIAAYVLSYDELAPEMLYIGQVGTRRKWRGRRIASGLLTEVLAAGAKVGKEVARLGVDATNPTGAVAIYERVGFVVEARAVSYAIPLS